MKRAKTIQNPSVVTNKNGKFYIDKVVHINLFPDSYSEKLPYHVFKFHKFFDGLIGYENLAHMKAVVNMKRHKLIIGNKSYEFSRYYPSSMNFHIQKDSIVPICTTRNGTFLVEEEINLSPQVILKPGLYSAEKNRALVHLSNRSKEESQKLNLFRNDKFMVENEKPARLNIPTNHLNKEEEKCLINTLQPFRDVFFQEGQKLTFTHDIKHKIVTTDETDH